MKSLFWYWILICVLMSCSESPDPPVVIPPPSGSFTVRAADLSFLPEIRNDGVVFKNQSGTSKDVLDILKEAGCNTVRLRLWHTPSTNHSSLSEVSQFAAEIKSKGFKLWIVMHYSDTWADPGNQTKPAIWNGVSLTDLTDSVYKYTKKVVALLRPEFIQIGNEINSGFLWPEGNISNTSNFITLLNSGINATRDTDLNTKVIIHFAGIDGADWFYNILKTNSVSYNIIGLSYYPRWHTKNLFQVQSVLTELNSAFNKEIIIAETGYPFTLQWNDWTNNIVGLEEHLISGYPATQQGQYDFLKELKSIMLKTKGGIGLAYWAPDWVAFKGNQATNGSPWENMTLFDFENKAVEGIQIFANSN